MQQRASASFIKEYLDDILIVSMMEDTDYLIEDEGRVKEVLISYRKYLLLQKYTEECSK